MNEELKLYFNDGLKRVNAFDAINELKKHGSFGVFCQFIDPKDNCLVQKDIVFYPRPQPSYCREFASFVFIAEHNSVPLYIPADMMWWADKQVGGGLIALYRETTVLIKGEYKVINFKLEVSSVIRINAYLDKRHESVYPARLHQLKMDLCAHIEWMNLKPLHKANLRHQELQNLKRRIKDRIEELQNVEVASALELAK